MGLSSVPLRTYSKDRFSKVRNKIISELTVFKYIIYFICFRHFILCRGFMHDCDVSILSSAWDCASRWLEAQEDILHNQLALLIILFYVYVP